MQVSMGLPESALSALRTDPGSFVKEEVDRQRLVVRKVRKVE